MTPLAVFSSLAGLRQHKAFTFLVILFGVFLVMSILAHSPGLLQFDQRVTRGFQKFRSPALDRLVRSITVLADPLALVLLGIAGTVVLLFSGHPLAGIFCALSVLGLPLNYGIKQIVRRPRPDAAIVKVLLPVVGRSFPSGHAMTAMMFYGFLGYLVWVHVHHPVVRTLGTLLFFLLAFAIGLSRVYLGVHWFSDVVGGWTAGLFFLVILALVYKTVSANTGLSAGRM